MNRTLKLKRETEPKFSEFNQMISALEDFLDQEADFTDNEWMENFHAIIDFQDSDGSFKFFDTFNVPGDARVDFCYIPTYLSCAVIMKALMTSPDEFTSRQMTTLSQGLLISCSRGLSGHGLEAFQGQIDALKIFMKAGLREFIDLHPDLCPEFTGMMEEIIENYRNLEAEERFTGQWGESYEEDIKAINRYFKNRRVFVYGTLMKGEANHRYLEDSLFITTAAVKGYEMYNVGWYPAVIPGDGVIAGELYQVPLADIPSIDMLEGEGTLYAKRCERITAPDGERTFAFIYTYLQDVSGLERISSWGDYVWYVSYGSNMLYERFLCYIQGGSFNGTGHRRACRDTSLPLAVKPIHLQYKMYFGNESLSWNGSGVSFLDTGSFGDTLAVAYLITHEQFNHVCRQENGGRTPGDGDWYEDVIDLPMIDGIEAKTLTNNTPRPINAPSKLYKKTLFEGIRQNWPGMSDEEIWDYLKG